MNIQEQYEDLERDLKDIEYDYGVILDGRGPKEFYKNKKLSNLGQRKIKELESAMEDVRYLMNFLFEKNYE